MGLDQYAFAVKDEEKTEISYWRKHNRLHGWMENLWLTKEGGNGEFNCVELELNAEDLDALEEVVKGKKLPKTDGFFFGVDSYRMDNIGSSNSVKDDLEFISKARIAIKNGKKIFYNSWY